MSYVYWPDGKVNYQARTNQVTTSFGYDDRGIVNLVKHHDDDTGHDLAKREYYWRDYRDRITAWKRGTDNFHNAMEDGRGDRYDYDPEGQLEVADYRAEHPDTTADDPRRRDYFYYDELGNRKGTNQVASRGLVNYTRRNNGLNQYLNWTPSVIYYDDNHPNQPGVPPVWIFPGNGVLMADGWITASFNALNQPVAMWCPTYGSNFLWFGYDPLGRCVKRWMGTNTGVPVGVNPTTYLYYDGWNLLQEGTAPNVPTRHYVHGGRVDEIVASRAGGQWYHHHYDARGHCIMLTDANGGIREQYDYDAFGMPYFYNAAGTLLGASAQFGNRFLFTGREWLKDLRVYDYRNRVYQPELGRFLQPDPKQFEAGDYNLYRYCHNDPVNNSDPTGLDLFPSPQSIGTSITIGFMALAKYEVQKHILGNAPSDDKAVHQITSQLMTELGDPVSAYMLGIAQEVGTAGQSDAEQMADMAANMKGIEAGIKSQLAPLKALIGLFNRSEAPSHNNNARDPEPEDPAPAPMGPKEISHDISF